MRKEDCFYLGKIAKKFSFKGEVLIYLDTDEPELYEDMESIFVEFNKNLIPFFIENSSLHKNDFLRVKFEDVDNEEQADEIINCEVYLPISMLPKLEGNKFYFHEVIGFEIEDKRLGVFGKIVSINDSSAQPLFEVVNGSVEILVPMIDQFLVKIDRENKKVIMDLPEGLVEMYL
ncbi:ribosome maturation factor RimM [Flavobacterium aquatile]|jgi:16S rRNA processing protein RimM|uniref:Ribosome maturation factor RimM n=1 Tax=Flavobacterium aquatile LMG 4008 = ATCC 11947 TaxID=1453498 RepID=A0A095SRM8_9FLAO|nr:ribosome maturation factor RimM [Flavobacterium aquatile]KGD67301.1 ribosome maturation factor RimM [Flavobacterium aquatile LMG 4008 = ATCC 11947]OXA66548.1 16S rRNA processing protein RimM [Flavobacterium aquatile LMG 4008 = ATCC 11947]GEC78524.1 ribosome maturation factor RimM [Flavobacterium aquatile]